MKIDIDNLNETVISNIDKSIGELGLAKDGIDGITSEYKPWALGSISSKISKISEKLGKIETKLNEKAEALANVEVENNSFLASLFASVFNAGAGLVKGAADVLESLLDAGASVLGTAAAGAEWLLTYALSGGDSDYAGMVSDYILRGYNVICLY